jgi:pyridoxal phosphate enzyme (YggS family)
MNRPEGSAVLDTIHDRIQKAAVSTGRNPQDIRIVAVSKTVPVDLVRTAIANGVSTLGENYIQEARDKISALSNLPVSWHFIGRLQSNKAKYAVRMFDLIHSVDSLKLARELDRQARKIAKTQEILIQVNVSKEKTKGGVSVDETLPLIRDISHLNHLRVKGLMTMPPFFDDPVRARPYFKALRELFNAIANQKIPCVEMTELSMGMSGDFEAAVAEGATLVRIGTAIFGSRS